MRYQHCSTILFHNSGIRKIQRHRHRRVPCIHIESCSLYYKRGDDYETNAAQCVRKFIDMIIWIDNLIVGISVHLLVC